MRDLTFVLPSRKCIHNKLEDAAMLNFKYVAETIEKTKEEGGTVTAGWDDTVKAAGHRLHDVKSGRVTCVTTEADEEGNEKRTRTSLTSVIVVLTQLWLLDPPSARWLYCVVFSLRKWQILLTSG